MNDMTWQIEMLALQKRYSKDIFRALKKGNERDTQGIERKTEKN